MALADNQNLSLMNYYKAHPEMLDADSRYLLAAAFSLVGDREAFGTTLPSSFGEGRLRRSFGGSFCSYLRDMAISLYTLVQADPGDQQIPILARALSQELRDGGWYSTQEQAFALLALGKLAHMIGVNQVKASIAINGRKTADFTGSDLILSDDINNKPVTIRTSDKGTLYYFYDVEGISASGQVKETDNYLSVRKAFYDRYGRALINNVFSQNDLVVVKVSIRSLLAGTIKNVAITDLLPACFEIENPRITPAREMSWIKDQSEADYMDIRDDRISFFITEGENREDRQGDKPQTHISMDRWTNFYYTVRVVSQGTFKMGPVSAEAMYDGQYHSVFGAGVVKVN